MAKKSATELKEEGAELAALLASARKRPLNFALLIAKEGVVLEGHPTRDPEVMRRQAKANGGTPRGIQGVMNVIGKSLELTSEDEDVPGPLAKLAKRHLKERGLAFKVIIILPNGDRMDDGEGDETEAEVGEAAPEPDDENATEVTASGADMKATLMARIRHLVPEVKRLVDQKAEGAEKLGRGLQAAGAEIAKEGFERAQQLLTAIEKALGDAKAAVPVPTVDQAALRAQLRAEFAELTDGLEDLKSRAAAGVAGKADQLGKMFDGLVQGEDLKKAGAVLSLIRTFVNSELGKMAESTGGIMDRLGAAVSEIALEAKGLMDKGLAAADDFVDGLTEDGRKKLELQALGYSEAEQDAIVASLATNPNAVAEAKAARKELANLDPAQAAILAKLAKSDPKAFAAALATLKSLDAGGELDISPTNMQASLERFEAARKAMTDAQAAQKMAEATISKASADIGKAAIALGVNRGLAAAAAKAVADFQAGLGDPASMPEAARNAALVESTRLINANEAAKKALAAAEKAQNDAVSARNQGLAAKATADKSAMAAKAPLATAEAQNDALDSKHAMLEAVSVGRLSSGSKPAFKDEDKAAFLAAFAKDGKLATDAMDIAARAKNPSVVAQNVGFVAGKMGDGFADPSGAALDLPREHLRAMAQNALQIGALQGEDYFKGFEAYLKTGAQLKPDPYGGLAEPNTKSDKAENQRQNKIALARSGAMGAAALQPDGKVDFGSDAAKGVMDHMMFHPGSLTTFTPQMTQKMTETKALFADATTGPKAQAVIAGTKLAAAGTAGRLNSQKIVAGTMGKKPADVTDNDTKGAVLSAMMTPLAQGPVGSCFSTAPVRAIRETNPLRAMGEYSKIATTGLFTAKDGTVYPANLTPPLGENPLMRSWEYSVATAAAELQTSVERNTLRWGLIDPGNAASNLLQIDTIISNAPAGSVPAPAAGVIPLDFQTKLTAAISAELKFEYNAGPLLGGAPGGGGDGSSTEGRYILMYGGAAVTTEAAYLTAIETIALAAAGMPKGSAEETQIVALIQSAAFKASILKKYSKKDPNDASATAEKYAPWDMSPGGMEAQTAAVLDGGAPGNYFVTKARANLPAVLDGQRVQDVLASILTSHKKMTLDMMPMGTSGVGAAHAFNTLPNHPSLDKIKDPNSTAKIQSELVVPGQALAARTLSLDETVMLFEKQINAYLATALPDARAPLVAALKQRPTAGLTPAALEAKVSAELAAYIPVAAQHLTDIYVTDTLPTATAAQKANILAFYIKQVGADIKGDMAGTMASAFALPEVVIADSNWGNSKEQTLFVVAPDPRTGALILWRKDLISGKMKPLGQNWADGVWDTVK